MCVCVCVCVCSCVLSVYMCVCVCVFVHACERLMSPPHSLSSVSFSFLHSFSHKRRCPLSLVASAIAWSFFDSASMWWGGERREIQREQGRQCDPPQHMHAHTHTRTHTVPSVEEQRDGTAGSAEGGDLLGLGLAGLGLGLGSG